MKKTTILVPLLFSNWVAGCDGTESPGEPVTVAIASDKAPALVAFRDGLDGSWQAATMKTPTSFEAEVHGPYVITVACEDPALGNYMISQIARTPDDEHSITLSCDLAAPSTHAVTGHMAQAGTVQIGNAIATSDTPSWDFALEVPAGTYDLMARTADRVVLRRAIAVAGDVALTAPIDVQQGTALTNVAFSVTNAAPAETLTASVYLEQPAPLSAFEVYQGPLATAKIVPDAALVATDKQTASMRATTAGGYRSLRRPFRAGGETAYTLPAPLTGVAWAQAGGKLGVSWGALPAFDSLVVSLSEGSTDATKIHGHNLKLSPRFVEATGLTRVDIDTEIAGYKPEWKIDLAGAYSRELFAQHTANGEIATNVVHELVNAPAQ